MRIMTTTTNAAEVTVEANLERWHRERERYYGDPFGSSASPASTGSPIEFETVAASGSVASGLPMQRTSRGSTETNGSNRPRARRDARPGRRSPYRGDSPNRLGCIARA